MKELLNIHGWPYAYEGQAIPWAAIDDKTLVHIRDAARRHPNYHVCYSDAERVGAWAQEEIIRRAVECWVDRVRET